MLDCIEREALGGAQTAFRALTLQAAGFERVAQDGSEFAFPERLFQIGERASVHRFDRRLDGRVAGNEHDRRVRPRLPELRNERIGDNTVWSEGGQIDQTGC